MNVALIVVLCIVAALVIAFFVWRGVRHHKLVKKTEEATGVKHQRRTVKEFICAHLPTKRRLVQIYAALLYNANIKGYITGSIYTSATTKYVCVPGLNCYSCPGAVGACPLGALQNALAESTIRAPYYVLGILAIFGVMFARTICGWLCPVGLGQELLYKIRTPKLRKSRVTRVLSYFKYVLLVVLVIIIPLAYAFRDLPLPGFCKYICPAGTIGGAIGLLIHPDNAEMFGMLGGQFAWKFSLLVLFIVASIFIFRFFCRFFCPLGALYGFFNRIALIGVKVDKDDCTNCGKCVAVCKMDVKRVGDHECINCGQCISACPTKAIRWKGSKLLLHKSAIDDKTQTLEKPIDLTANKKISLGATATEAITEPAATVETEPTVTPETSEEVKTETPITETATTKVETPEKKKRGASFWVQLAAWVTAIIVLIGALVFYNFIDVEKPDDSGNGGGGDEVKIGYTVGDLAPDFTVELYGSDESFTLYDNRGKITVINFWATWCTPCVNEIPYFNELAANHPEIDVIAIHGSSTRPVEQFIKDRWGELTISLTFAQDNLNGGNCLTYLLLGGKSTWPMTVIVDEDGYVIYNSTQSFHDYEDLENKFKKLVEERTNADNEAQE
ncbi:MAG: redoxin family protein [Clostridiales bacterium]|nr:redoxin family protein [Clostridiales bacterium]